MTVKMLTAWSGYPKDYIGAVISPAEEARLVGIGFASYDLDGVDNDNVDFAVRGKRNPLTGGVSFLIASGAYAGPDVLAFPFTSDGVDDAIARVIATGVPGTVRYAAADYAITRAHAFVPNVSHIGVPPKLVFTGDIPDAEFSCSGGTRFIVDAGVSALTWNNVDKGAEETNIAENACSGVKVYGLTFVGGAKAIDTGAYLAMGMVFSEFDQLYAFDQSIDYALDFKNFQHCKFGRLYQSSGNLTSGGGVRFASSLSPTLLPGNSEVGEVYTYCKNRLNRSITIEASGPAGCVLNQLKVSGRLQGNRYGSATPDAISMTFTNGSADISVPDNTQFAMLPVGMPVVLNTTAPTGFEVKVVYFVRSRGANTVQLAETEWAASSISAGASGGHTAHCSGWPAIHVRKTVSTNAVKNSDLGQWDAEAYGNVAAIVVAGTRNCVAFLSETMTSYSGTALVARDAEIGLTYGGTASLTQDVSGSSGNLRVTNLAGGPYAYSGGSFTLDASWSGRAVRYTGTADITITVPLNLPKGFEFSITPTGATGIVTFAVASGGGVYSSGSKLRTLGQYATARLENIANKVYRLTGDLQV